MRRLVFIALLAALAGGAAVTAGASKPKVLKATGKVVGVTAGDTLQVRVGGKVEQIRMLGVTAPTGCYARQSRGATRALVLGKTVLLLGERGRSGAYVAVGGRDLGRLLVARGAAQIDVWGARFARFAAYVPVQQKAETAAKGMWGACGADVSLTMTGPEQGAVGDPVTYTISAENAGPLAARHLLLELRPASGAVLVSADTARGTCAAKGWFASCSLESFLPGATAKVTLVVRPTRPGTLSAHAAAALDGCIAARCGSAPLQDPNLENDEAAALTTVAPAGATATRICDPDYPTICIPPPPPDLNCADIVPNRNFPVPRNIPNFDDHHLDGNNDGIGCQFDDY